MSLLKLNQVKSGALIQLDNKPYRVIFAQFSKLGRGGGILNLKLKGLADDVTISKTFKGEDKIEQAELDQTQAQFLYKKDNNFYFMDSQTFEQFSLSKDQIGLPAEFLVEGTQVNILLFNEKPVSCQLPIKMDLKVIHAEPGVRGDSATAPTKNAVLESGAKIKVPIFVKVGDVVRVDTRDGSYVERVKN